MTFVRPHAPYPVANADSDVVADWLVHFPQCHEFLDALVAARFASSRKNAYLFSVRSPIGVRGCCLVLAAFCHAWGRRWSCPRGSCSTS